jgi:acyl-CoA synthetase (AMP-forming)/AMP-acid ligase II
MTAFDKSSFANGLTWSREPGVTASAIAAAAVGFVGPILIGAAVGRLDAGIVAALGALAMGGRESKLTRSDFAIVVLTGGVAMLLGTLLVRAGAVGGISVVALAAVAAVLAGFSRRAARTAVEFVIYLVMATCIGAKAFSPLAMVTLFASGSLWTGALLLMFAALFDGARFGSPVVAIPAEPLPPMRQRLARWGRTLTQIAGWQYAIRISLCLAAAWSIEILWPGHHASWIALTAVIVVRPQVTELWTRTFQRAAGTAIGVMIGAVLLLWQPPTWGLLTVIALIAAARPFLKARNYLAYSAVMTPLVLLILDFDTPPTAALISDRLVATVIGGGLALASGRLFASPPRFPMTWNYADIWESIAAARPDHPVFVQGAHATRWRDANADANALAAALLAAGLRREAKVAVYLYNCPQYLIAYFAAFKTALVPFNVNYRYGAEELVYLLDNSDAEAVVFHAEASGTIDGIRDRLPKIKLWISVARKGAVTPDWAIDYGDLTRATPSTNIRGPNIRGPWGRSGDDLMLIYTGGTTGMPKGVMWRQEDLWGTRNFGASALLNLPPMTSPEQAGPRAGHVSLIGSPLMHGTGLMSAISAISLGGTAAYLPSRQFDAGEMWTEVNRHRASQIAIVGSAFCLPMVDALENNPQRWDLACVRIIASSGAVWSSTSKQALLRFLPRVALVDALSSSEALGLGVSTTTARSEATPSRFRLGPTCAVFTENGRRILPGSGERGRVAISGHIPIGYYKDPAATAAAFPEIEGRRWSMPGDWATVNEDGTLALLGRDSQTINTAGERSFPKRLKRH